MSSVRSQRIAIDSEYGGRPTSRGVPMTVGAKIKKAIRDKGGVAGAREYFVNETECGLPAYEQGARECLAAMDAGVRK